MLNFVPAGYNTKTDVMATMTIMISCVDSGRRCVVSDVVSLYVGTSTLDLHVFL
jgi:hypothetical protein